MIHGVNSLILSNAVTHLGEPPPNARFLSRFDLVLSNGAA
jgi:hypothetical protein